MDNKTELRTSAKALRKTLDIPKISTELVKSVRQNEIYKNSTNIMLFYPTKYEVDLRDLFYDNKIFYLPRVNTNTFFIKESFILSGINRDIYNGGRGLLEVCPYKIGDKLVESEFGILEPVTKPVDKEVLDLVIVPALMADKNGYRLGYGGGFYDKFLKDFMGQTICAIPEEFFVDELPHDEFDIRIKNIITI